MTTFENREEGFEKRFAVDEELAFKALARRNKLLGLWLAGKLGREDGESYARALVADNVGSPTTLSLRRYERGSRRLASTCRTIASGVQ